jgi:uncharacterized phage infection (PIP) family protein YhgE
MVRQSTKPTGKAKKMARRIQPGVNSDSARLRRIEKMLKMVLHLVRIDVHLDAKGTMIMSAQLDALKTQVEAMSSASDSAQALLQTLSAQIASLKDDPAALQALADSLSAESAELAAAVTANTPSEGDTGGGGGTPTPEGPVAARSRRG